VAKARLISVAILACALASSAAAAPPFEATPAAPPTDTPAAPAPAVDTAAPKRPAKKPKPANKAPDKAPEKAPEKKDALKLPVAPECSPGTTAVSAQVLLAELQSQKVRFAELLAASEALEFERVELELARAELFGNSPVPLPPPASEDIAKVAATVRVMKPAAAAPLLSKLDPSLASEVLRALAKPAAAAILEKMPPDFAADLVRRLAAPPPDLAGQG
jgi:flagellar motility protein MotE (MotC chaperone)